PATGEQERPCRSYTRRRPVQLCRSWRIMWAWGRLPDGRSDLCNDVGGAQLVPQVQQVTGGVAGDDLPSLVERTVHCSDEAPRDHACARDNWRQVDGVWLARPTPLAVRASGG